LSAFAGIRVLDASQGLAGPMAAMMLADLGAEVIKAEPAAGDSAQAQAGYVMWNRGKARLAADPEDAEGLDQLKRLAASADVAIFDHAPGRLEAIGLDAASLRAANPRLVHAWMPPFGTTGEFSDLPAHHGMLTGLTGAAFRQGSYANQPVWHVAPLVHYGQAVMGAAAIGAALVERASSGQGEAVVCSGLHGMSEIAGGVSMLDMAGGYKGHPLGGSASYRLYQCGDGDWLFMGTLFPHFFQRAIEAIRDARPPPYPGVGDVMGLLERVFAERPAREWVDILKAAETPVADVCPREDWLASELIADNDMRCEVQDERLGTVVMPGIPVKFSASPGHVRGLLREAGTDDLAAFTARRPVPAPAEPRPLEAPLKGVRVLDLGTVIAGAYTSAILASFGADVVKVEPADGDPFRPYGTGFMSYNRGKRGLGLDLKSPAGRQCFIDMARAADVVIDNYRNGVRQRLGIDYETLKAVNPRIISLSITCYGSKGKDAHLPGFDPLLQARSGLMSAQGGGPGHEPVFHSIAINDVATSAMGAFGVIAALHHRAMTGEGQAIETSLTAQSAIFQSGDLVDYEGRPSPNFGGRDCLGFAALDRYYPCADGWLTIACTRPAEFDALARVLGRPDWPGQWPDPLGEVRDGELAFEIERALEGRRRDEVSRALREAGVPAAPVMRGQEAVGHEWLWENGFYELSHHPHWGDLVGARCYADFGRCASGYERLHPELGEHGLEVLLEYGIPREIIVQLANNRVIFRG
jgi:crotonobetainyl-CoA:carnitine CoA-transferase CaiB-like acyl-CoA transferase